MRMPWQQPDTGEALRPTDHRIRCMDCHSDRPMASVLLLRSYGLRDGRVVSEVTGERVACQDCGSVFSIGPSGTFRHHAAALPYPTEVPIRTLPRGGQEDATDQPHPDLPKPRARPEV